MSDATEFRAGDIAMVDGKPAVWLRLRTAHRDGSPIELWRWLDGDWRDWTSQPAEVGPLLGNVADIAAMGVVTALLAQGFDHAVSLMAYEDGTPVEIVNVANPYREVTP